MLLVQRMDVEGRYGLVLENHQLQGWKDVDLMSVQQDLGMNLLDGVGECI